MFMYKTHYPRFLERLELLDQSIHGSDWLINSVINTAVH